MKEISPLLKGIITGTVMLLATLVLFYFKPTDNSGMGYLTIVIYAAGIIWTLFTYFRSPGYVAKFANIFGQGFRCFIIVTLIMVSFTAIFSMTHPEFAENDSQLYRQYLTEKKEKTPAEVDEMVASNKKHYTTGLIYSAIFGYLVLGTLFTAAAGGGLFLIRRKV